MPKPRAAAAAPAGVGGRLFFFFFVVVVVAASLTTTTTEAFVVPLPRPSLHHATRALPRPGVGGVAISMMAAAGGSGGSGVKPPVANLKQLKYDYTAIINQAAKAATDAIKGGLRLITVDYPPAEGPTNIRRFETDRDFTMKLLAAMGYKTVVPIGDEIIIGKNLKIGEYLSMEGLTGFSGKGFGAGVPCPSVSVVLNPSLDASNLRGLQKQMDDGSSPLVLVNCNLERLTFLDKLGNPFIEKFAPAYVLKKANQGFLLRASHTAPWDTFAIFQDAQMGPYLAQIDSTGGARPKYLDVENKVKAVVAANAEALREAAEEAKQLNNSKGRTAGGSASGSKSPFW